MPDDAGQEPLVPRRKVAIMLVNSKGGSVTDNVSVGCDTTVELDGCEDMEVARNVNLSRPPQGPRE